MKITRRICLRLAGVRGAEAVILAGAGDCGDWKDGRVVFVVGVSSVVWDVEVVITYYRE